MSAPCAWSRHVPRRSLLLVLAIGASAVLPLAPSFASSGDGGFEECVEECIDTYRLEVSECVDELTVCLEGVADELEECVQQAGGNPIEEAICVRRARLQRGLCERSRRRCEDVAVTNLYNCYRACSASPERP